MSTEMERVIPLKVGEEPRDAVGGYLGAVGTSTRSALFILVILGLCLMFMLAATVDRSVLQTIDDAMTNVLESSAQPKAPGAR